MRSRCPIIRRTALRAVLTLAVAVLARFASVLAIGTAVSARPPNIVVILTDDQGYADISFNPHHPKEVSTPHLDALARESVWFSQGYITQPRRRGHGLILDRRPHSQEPARAVANELS